MYFNFTRALYIIQNKIKKPIILTEPIHIAV